MHRETSRSQAYSKSHRWNLVAAVGWTIVILALSTIPAPDLPTGRIPGVDKVAHFILFAAFGWLWIRSFVANVDRRFKQVVLAGLAYAVLTELYQGVLPFGREPDAWDAVANSAGLLAGAVFGRYLVRRSTERGVDA